MCLVANLVPKRFNSFFISIFKLFFIILFNVFHLSSLSPERQVQRPGQSNGVVMLSPSIELPEEELLGEKLLEPELEEDLLELEPELLELETEEGEPGWLESFSEKRIYSSPWDISFNLVGILLWQMRTQVLQSLFS
jgi:hypothetical protein